MTHWRVTDAFVMLSKGVCLCIYVNAHESVFVCICVFAGQPNHGLNVNVKPWEEKHLAKMDKCLR